MDAEVTAALRSPNGLLIPLREVRLDATAEGCLLEVRVEQHYANIEAEPIEAVYTFPLPVGAVLLGLELEIGERRLAGSVQRRRAAATGYEQAIESGDSAALLEQAANGLYTVSLGNLMPGETAKIRYRYGEWLSQAQGRVRISLPTVIPSRYGNVTAALAPHQVPEVNAAIDHVARFSLALQGALARGSVSSPTHAFTTSARDGILHLEAAPGLRLDRDIVVIIDGLNASSQAVVARDGEHFVAAASLVMPKPQDAGGVGRAVKILLDCSGSMAGHKMSQARDAILAVLSNLSDRDYVSLTCFGSHVEHRTRGLERATRVTRARLGILVRMLNANLGGTEMEVGLDTTTAIQVPEGFASDVLLITDGEIWSVTSLIERVRGARHRLFLMALGMSSNEPLARIVSRDSRGACEFVTLNEDSRAATDRILGRMRDPARTVSALRWPGATCWSLGMGQAAFSGDALQVMAGFESAPDGALEVSVSGESVPVSIGCTLPLTLMQGDTLCRLAAAQRLATLTADEAAELAVHYQLVTEHTSCLVVAEREAGTESLGSPALRTVPQMAAAGHAGFGSAPPGTPSFLRPGAGDEMLSLGTLFGADAAPLPAPAAIPLRRGLVDKTISPTAPRPRNAPASAPAPVPALVARIVRRLAAPGPLPATLAELDGLGVDAGTQKVLRRLVDSGHVEADVVLAWLALVLRGGNALLDERLGRRIQSGADLALVDAVQRELKLHAA